MNIQTAIPTPVNGQAENKPGSVRRNENGGDGFETALRNNSENRYDENAGEGKGSQAGERFGLKLADNNGSKSTETPLAAQARTQDSDVAADSPLLDQTEHADMATQQAQRPERPPISTIQNWVNRLHALDGQSEVNSVKPAAIEMAANGQPDSPLGVSQRTELNEQDPARKSKHGSTMEIPVSHVAVAGKPVLDNPGRAGSEASVSPHPAVGRPHGRSGSQVEKVDAAPQSAIERMLANANPIEDSNVAETKASSPADRVAMTHKADVAAANSLPGGQANTLAQQGGTVTPAPPVPVTATPDGSAKTNPATGSLLTQLEQVEVIRELAASDRLGFVSRLSQNGGSVQVLRLQLKPAELGTVTAHMRMENGQMTVELIAEKDAAFRQLSKDMSIMQTAMRSMGIIVDEIVVSQGSTGAGAHHSTGDQQRGASESRGESGFGQRPGQQSNDGDTTHDSSRNNTSDSNSDISSGIYI